MGGAGAMHAWDASPAACADVPGFPGAPTLQVLDTMGDHWQAWKQVVSEVGLTFTHAQFFAKAGKPTSTILRELCAEQGVSGVDIAAGAARKTELYLQRAGDTRVVEAVMDIVREARARGLKCAIATGGSRRQVVPALAASRLWTPEDATHFDAVVTADDVTHGKPHPETYLLAAAAIGIAPERCVGYEDAALGMQSIQAANYLLAVDVTQLEG